jgi:hypothetical protein
MNPVDVKSHTLTEYRLMIPYIIPTHITGSFQNSPKPSKFNDLGSITGRNPQVDRHEVPDEGRAGARTVG